MTIRRRQALAGLAAALTIGLTAGLAARAAPGPGGDAAGERPEDGARPAASGGAAIAQPGTAQPPPSVPAPARRSRGEAGTPPRPAARPDSTPELPAAPGRISARSVLGPVLAGGAPAIPADPVALAAHITVAEDVARDPRSDAAQVAAAGWVAQMCYRALGYRPEWDDAVLAAVADRYRADVRRHAAARREFQALAPSPLPGRLPAWRIIDPLPAPALRELYVLAQERFGVPWEVLAAINLVETGMGRIVGLSSAGADGPMQFIPETWRRYGMGGDVRDPRDAIMGAANYLRARGAAAGTDRGLRRALFSYNNSDRYVRAVRHYAAIISADPAAYAGLHAWRIYFRTTAGDILLPLGYSSRRSIPVKRYLAQS